MLYIFHVDKGSMMTYEMNVALLRVHQLKEIIHNKTKIPVEKQVLLISGGIALDDNEEVCNYSGGTDTNPIFLFDVKSIGSHDSYFPPSIDQDTEEAEIRAFEIQVKDQVEASINQPPCLSTVNNRSHLAQNIYDVSREQLSYSETIVIHQHLQQQGWGAVIANLEDILISLSKNFEGFNYSFEEYLKTREESIALLVKIDKDVDVLKKIPLLPTIKSPGRAISDSAFEHDGLFAKHEEASTLFKEVGVESLCETSKMSSLYDWMRAFDLCVLLERLRNRLNTFDPPLLKKFQDEFNSVSSEVRDKPDIKEIKGLGDRLSQLDSLLRDGRKQVEEQKILAESFHQNKARSGSLKDDSIYPSLCESQIQYLKQMLSNFLKITDIRKRCIKAKIELSMNIVFRLRWILFIEQKVTDLLSRIDIYGVNIRRIESELRIYEQIHHAPKLYFSAISEVIRRQKFTKKYVQWTSLLSAESREIWEKELQTRKEFGSHLASHFLYNLFPGLCDFPPSFATEKPKEFDQYLPQLCKQYLQMLRSHVPELGHLINIEEPKAIPPIIEAGLRSADNTNTLTPSSYGKDIASAEFFASAVASSPKGSLGLSSERSEVGSMSPKPQSSSRPSSLLRDQPESETDTEEFEKVCGSISDGTYSPMESMPDTKSAKTKHSFPSQTSDSKHIKLDSSHRIDEQCGTTIRLEPLYAAQKKPVSPTECLPSPASQPSPEEFVSPDFYIDESMPSSYTESTGTTTTTSSGANKHHALSHHTLHVKSHHVITAELQKQIDEKNLTLLTLQSELGNSRAQIENLQARLNTLATLSYKTVLKDLRQEMENLKDKVKDEETSYINYISELSSRILDGLEKIQKETEASQETAVKSALSMAQLEEDEKRNTLQAQLVDTSRELEIYQGQTRDYITQIDRLKCWMKEERAQLIAEKEESVKRLTLEHELEMEALKEQWRQEELKRGDEATCLTEKIQNLDSHLAKIQTEKENLSKKFEEKYEQKYREKEESIRQILGATYSEHEKKCLEVQKKDLVQAFNIERLQLQEVHENELKSKTEELRRSFEFESERRLTEEQEEAEKKHAEELQRCRELWEAQKEEEVEGKKEELKAQLKSDYDQKLETAKLQYKMDLEGLRSRFRMMTTASMDKSPSETSLEKFERGDFVETTYHDIMLAKLREELLEEKEKALEEMKKGLEEQHSRSLEEERNSNEEKRKEERRRMEAEKQEIFKEISQDKERVIEDLRLRVEFLTDETEKLRKSNAKAHEEALALTMPLNIQEWQERCELYKKEVDRLEKEVQRAKRLSFVSEKHPDLFPDDVSSSSSTSTITSEFPIMDINVHKLQQDNKELRNALIRSSDRKRVSLDDAQVHDVVLVVWDELYSQYRILLESQTILHFLHSDSYASLGLSKGPEKPEKLFCTAQVTRKKEFCQAKRDGNRFRVPRGTKFYRVEAGPCVFPKQEENLPKEKTRKIGTAESPLPEGAEGTSSGSST